MSALLENVLSMLKAEEAELRRRGVTHLAVFGSLARGTSGPDSDVDLAIEIEPGRPFSLIRMEDTRLYLQDRLGRSVDLGEVETLRDPVRSAFERQKVQVF